MEQPKKASPVPFVAGETNDRASRLTTRTRNPDGTLIEETAAVVQPPAEPVPPAEPEPEAPKGAKAKSTAAKRAKRR